MIEAKHQINDVRRELGTRVLEAGEAWVATISQVYDTGVADLWEAVTSPERIPRWFLPVTGDLSEGGRYQLEGNAGGTITRCTKPHGYAATWEFGGEISWIEVRLTAAGPGRTRFELDHIYHEKEGFWDQYGPGATGVGWDGALVGLSMYLADPSAPVDPAAVAAWSASDDGKTFLRMSADAWADAHIAAGGDEPTARRMADACYAFYTGG